MHCDLYKCVFQIHCHSHRHAQSSYHIGDGRGLWPAGAVKVPHWDQGTADTIMNMGWIQEASIKHITVVFLFSVVLTIYSDSIIVPQQPIRPICGSETSHSLVMRAVGLATRHRNLAVVKH